MTILPALYSETNCTINRLDAMFLSVFAIYILKMLYQILDAASNVFFSCDTNEFESHKK